MPRPRRLPRATAAAVVAAAMTVKRKAPQPAFARLAVADELGLLKVVEVPAGPNWSAASVVQVWGEPSKDNSIHALAAPNYLVSPAEDVLAVSRRGGSGQLFNTHDGRVLCTLPLLPPSAPKADVKCLAFRQQPDQPLGLVSCSTSGMLSVLSSQGPAADSSAEGGEEQGVQGTGASGWHCARSMQTLPNVQCMALDSSGDCVALGGEGCQLQIWNIATAQQAFKAKGAKPNKVGNVDLPHLTAVTFIPSEAPGQVALVGTVKHKLWLYDVRAGQRPQLDLTWGDARVTSLEPEAGGARVWAANGSGRIEALDLRGKIMKGSMKGAAGSVRSLTLHPDASQPLLASVSLDRFMRVHDTTTRASACKVYCKQQLAAVAWLAPLASADVDKDAAAGEATGDEGAGGVPAAHEGVQSQAAHTDKRKKKSKHK